MHIKLNTWRRDLTLLLAFLASGGMYGAFADDEITVNSDSTWSHYTTAELFMEGSVLMEEEFWHEAERVWAYAMKSRPKNRVLKYRRAICLYEIAENWEATKTAYQEVVQGPLTHRYDPFNPNQKLPPFEAWLGLASTEHRLGQFEQAREHVDQFLAMAGEKHPSKEWASKILAEIRFAERQLANPTQVTVVPFAFNSDAQETHPVMTADGRTLFFSSNQPRSNGSNHGRLDPNTKEHFYDIYSTSLKADSSWSEPQMLNVGLRHHATVVGSDAFGEKLIVLDNDGWTSELKLTQKWERGWTVAEPFLLDKKIPSQGEIAFFPRKDRLIASVKSRRGEGGYDLYESSLGENGHWSKLKSLGNRVNTWGDELTPFVAADGQTVFFASNGLESMGGFDIYRTTRDAAGGWTEPEHLGSPINSVDDDLAFAIGAKGQVGYFATRRDVTRGDLDVYEAHMNGGRALEERVVILSMNAEGIDNVDQPDVLLVRDAETGEVVQRVKKSGATDVYHFILPTGREFIVESESASNSESAGLSEPALRRRIILPEDSKAEVIDVTFEEVFVSEAAKLGSDGTEVVFEELEAFVVKPRPVVLPTVESKEEVAEEVAEETASTESGSEKPVVAKPHAVTSAQLSDPIAPMALVTMGDASMVLAVQLYNGQVHTERMDLVPVLDAVVAASKQGKAVVRIEGSASDGPSTRAGGNMELASSRAMDVYLRLVRGLEARGLTKGKDYAVRVVRRVQPDGDTPLEFNRSAAHPASFQYVRVDLSVE